MTCHKNNPLILRGLILDTPLNKKALDKVTDIFYKDLEDLNKGFNNCIFKDKKTVFKALTQEFNKIMSSLKTQEDLIKAFKFKYSNNKIDLSIIINSSPYLLCPNMIKGSCNLCNKCYSSKQELSHKKGSYNSINKWLNNYIFFNYLRFIKNPQGLLYKAFLKIKKSYDNKIKKPIIVRFDEKSDIQDTFILRCYSFLSELFYKFFKIGSYTYTKTRGLSWDNISPHLHINKSLGLLTTDNRHNIDIYNMFVTVDNQEDLNYLLSRGFIKCVGSCLKCGFTCSKFNKSRVCIYH